MDFEVRECWSCGHRLMGGGCYEGGRIGHVGTKRVRDHDSCEKWTEYDTPGTINAEQTAWEDRLKVI
jgi:hypothetical protein